MSLQSNRELQATRAKLQMLEDRLAASQRESDGDAHLRALSQRSLKRLVNQLKEEIARFEARVPG